MSLTKVTAPMSVAVPPGAVMSFARSTPPTGWIICDGAQLSTSAYPDLWNAIGYQFGGSGPTFFIPDLRGIFVRGSGSSTITVNTSSVTYSGTFAERQQDQIQNITGSLYGTYAAIVRTDGGSIPIGAFTGSQNAVGNYITSPSYTTFQYADFLNFNASNSPGTRTGTQTHPANISLLYCIKWI